MNKSPPVAILAKSNNNGESVIAKIERMGVTLRTEPNYSADFATKRVKFDLFIAINAHPHRRTEWLMQAAAPN